MRRVAITGMGIISSLGNNPQEVEASLRAGKSGISAMESFAEMGFRSQVAGQPTIDIEANVDKRVRRFMGDGAAWNFAAMEQAIADAGLSPDDVSNPMTGLIMGSGGPSTNACSDIADVPWAKVRASSRRVTALSEAWSADSCAVIVGRTTLPL